VLVWFVVTHRQAVEDTWRREQSTQEDRWRSGPGHPDAQGNHQGKLTSPHEKDFLTKVKTFHGVDIGSIAVASDDGNGNGVTMAEYTIKAEMQDGTKFWPEQVQVSTWKDGKIVALSYYYNPNF
jgi:hypothetical protein